MGEAFRLGGWGMYPTLVFGLAMIGVALRYAVRPEGRFVPLLVVSGLLTLFGGALGFVTGLIATFQHIEEVRAEDRWIAMIGIGESLHNLGLALTLVVSRMGGNACSPLPGVQVDLWQCDHLGIYSDVQDPQFETKGKKFLRGYQTTDRQGRVGSTES